jgi:DNA-binding LacI/PurR family transcriptional regulator
MPPGPRPRNVPTMKDVAREAGVSKALVSIVFRDAPGASEATRRKVLEAAERLGYRGNRGASLLALTRTRQLGIVHDLDNGFHAEVVEAALDAADAAGYQAVLSPRSSARGELRAIDTALEFRCEALLVLGPTLPDEQLRQVAAGVPVVCIGRDVQDPRIDVALSRDEAGMDALVGMLVAQGHRRFAHVDGGDGSVSAARRDGVAQALARHGITEPARFVRGGSRESDGRRAALEALGLGPTGTSAGTAPSPERPTAVIAFNDLVAVGVLDAVLEAGFSVPQDLALTGYDDSPLARTGRIDLTSVRQDGQRLGAWAAAAAIERLDEGRTEPASLRLEPELRVRGTTGPVRTR